MRIILKYCTLTLFTLIPIFLSAQGYFHEKGKASFYADKFEGRMTASGEKFRQNKFTAAHNTLPFGTLVRVSNTSNGKSVEVVINDRGPFVKGRIIDLSKSAAKRLDFINDGITSVEIEVIKEHDPKHKTYQRDKPDMKEPLSNNDTYYSVSVAASSPKGFGVQVASYKEQSNLLGRVTELKKAYKTNVNVQLTNLNGTKIYKVIVGELKTRGEAEILQSKIKKKYKGCFIIEFDQ